MNERLTNWAGNYTYNAKRIHHPESFDELQSLVRHAAKVRVLGSRHSFNAIADTHEDLISLSSLEQNCIINHQQRTVTVPAGYTYGQLSLWLQDEGYALHNLASLPHISVAGACATATHGSGDRNGNLATAVIAFDLITADGARTVFSQEQSAHLFNGAVVGLGSLGVVTNLTLRIEPAYEVQQHVYENLPLNQLKNHFDEVMGCAYSVSLFTDWQTTQINQVWAKSRTDKADQHHSIVEELGASPAPETIHPIRALSAVNCTEQMGVPGQWFDRLPHFRIGFVPSSGVELQSEYFVPRNTAVQAIEAIESIRDHIIPHLMISEIRTVATDSLWLSPCYNQDCVALHFTWLPDWQAVSQVLPVIEHQLMPFRARPHWGKLFTLPAEYLQSVYKMMPQFRQLVQQLDPGGKFCNEYLANTIFG